MLLFWFPALMVKLLINSMTVTSPMEMMVGLFTRYSFALV